jgi:hypothetical protein
VDVDNAYRAQALKALNLGSDIVGFDIQVDTAWVINLLHLNFRVTGTRFQPPVPGVIAAGVPYCFQTQCVGPECRRLVEVIGLAVDNQATELALVHDGNLPALFRPSTLPPEIGACHLPCLI